MAMEQFYEDNRNNWNDRAKVHVGSEMYRMDEYATNPAAVSDVVRFDMERIGSIDGLSVAHLQCHVGTDTLSLERLGAASVVGVDFSPVAIAEARNLIERAGAATRLVEASVYDAPQAVGHTVDFVYTSIGTICWLHDMDAWAAAVAGLLEPGGRFYIRDVHPFLFIFEEVDGKIQPHFPYWYTPESPLSWDDDQTYSDNPEGTAIVHTRSHEWNHSLPEIVNALVGAGMRIDQLDEHRMLPWQYSPSCVKEADGWYLPEPLRSQVPSAFSLHATKL
jgi:SAM-dependent methyltransferase